MTSIPRVLDSFRWSPVPLVLALLVACPLHALEPEQQVQQVLYSLGVQRLFVSVQPLVARELKRHRQQGLDSEWDEEQILKALDPAQLQAAVERHLLDHYQAQTYAQAIAVLSAEDIVPVIQSCHGQALQDYGPQLQAYEKQLELQPAKPERQRLALQMDQAARTSLLAAQLQSSIDQFFYTLGNLESAVPWEEVTSERVAVLQGPMQTWYLYCARFYRDEQLQATIESYHDASVLVVLDQYQAALKAVVADAASGLVAADKP